MKSILIILFLLGNLVSYAQSDIDNLEVDRLVQCLWTYENPTSLVICDSDTAKTRSYCILSTVPLVSLKYGKIVSSIDTVRLEYAIGNDCTSLEERSAMRYSRQFVIVGYSYYADLRALSNDEILRIFEKTENYANEQDTVYYEAFDLTSRMPLRSFLAMYKVTDYKIVSK